MGVTQITFIKIIYLFELTIQPTSMTLNTLENNEKKNLRSKNAKTLIAHLTVHNPADGGIISVCTYNNPPQPQSGSTGSR